MIRPRDRRNDTWDDWNGPYLRGDWDGDCLRTLAFPNDFVRSVALTADATVALALSSDTIRVCMLDWDYEFPA
jgi:hypothetical protein